jgi:hypothetical protein
MYYFEGGFQTSDALYAVKEYLHRKLQTQRKSCVKIHRISPLNQALKYFISQA